MNQYLSLFRNRNFLRYFLAGAISNVGDFFNSLALIKLLSEDPQHLGLYFALIMIAKMVPTVVLGPIAGVLADRFPRRTIMITSDLLRAVLVLGLVFVQQPVAILTLVFLAASVSAFFNPASGALLPTLVKSDEMVTAGALAVMTQRMAMLLGNAAGALVLMVAGAHNVFYIDAASFLLSALLLSGMRLPAAARGPHAAAQTGIGLWQHFRSDVSEALAFLRKAPAVCHLFGTFAVSAVGDAGVNVLLVPFVTVTLALAAEKWGFVWALNGGGAVLGALAMGAVGNRIHWRHLIAFGATYVWATLMGALVASRLVPSVICLTLLGLGSGAINVGAQAAIAQLVPDQVRGRIFSAWGMLQNLIYIIGTLVAGAFSDRFGPVPVMMGFTVSYLVMGVYAYVALRPTHNQTADKAVAG